MRGTPRGLSLISRIKDEDILVRCTSEQVCNGRKHEHTTITAIALPTGIGRNIRPETPGLKWCPSVNTIGYASKRR